MAISVVQTLTPNSFVQNIPDLQPGDALLFIYSTEGAAEPSGAATDLSLTTSPGAVPTSFTLAESPDDTYWQPYFLYEFGNASDVMDEYLYFCLWPLNGFAAGAYSATFALPATDNGKILWGVVLRGLDLTSWGVTQAWPVYSAGHPAVSVFSGGGIAYNDFPYDVALTGVASAYSFFFLTQVFVGDGEYLAQDATYGDLVAAFTYSPDPEVLSQFYVKGAFAVADDKLTLPEPNFTDNPIGATRYLVEYFVLYGTTGEPPPPDPGTPAAGFTAHLHVFVDGAFVNIAAVRDISGPSMATNQIDVSSRDAAAGAFLPGMYDPGEIVFDIVYDPDEASHSATGAGLVKLGADGTTVTWSLNFLGTTPAVCAFSGFITGFSAKEPMDGALTADLTIKISGALAWA